MSHVEERLLEQLIWKSGSPVFRLLEMVRAMLVPPRTCATCARGVLDL